MSAPISFRSGESSVHGRLFVPRQRTSEAPVLLCSGFPGNPEDVLGLGEYPEHRGIVVMMFNYRGTCESEGVYSLENSLEDIGAAADWLTQFSRDGLGLTSPQLVLGGYSFGGGMVLTYAAGHLEFGKIFSIAGTDHGEFARLYQHNLAAASQIDELFDSYVAPQRPVRFGGSKALRELMANPDPYDIVKCAPQLADRQLLLIGGWDDMNIRIEYNLLPVYRALRSAGANNVQLVAFHDDHSFLVTREAIGGTIARWLGARETTS